MNDKLKRYAPTKLEINKSYVNRFLISTLTPNVLHKKIEDTYMHNDKQGQNVKTIA